MSCRPLILASASPRRQELLRQLQVEFEVWPAEVEELYWEQLTARELSLLNAYRKARAVAKKYPDDSVLGADTLVHGTIEGTTMIARLPAATHVAEGKLPLRFDPKYRHYFDPQTGARIEI